MSFGFGILNTVLDLDMERGTMQRVFNERREGLRGGDGVGKDAKRLKRGNRQAFPNPDITRRKWEESLEGVNGGELGTKLDLWMKGGDAILGFRPEHNPFASPSEIPASSGPTRFSPARGPMKANRAGSFEMTVTPSRIQAYARSAKIRPWSDHGLRLVGGRDKDLQRVAEEADKPRSMESYGKPPRVSTPPKRRKENFSSEDPMKKIRKHIEDKVREKVSASLRHERSPTADDLRGVATNSESPPPTPSQSNKPLRRGSPELELPPSTRGFNRSTTFRRRPMRRGSTSAQNSTSQHPPKSGKRKQTKGEDRHDALYVPFSRTIDYITELINTVGLTGSFGPPETIRTSESVESNTLSSNFKDSGLYMRYTISQDASMKTSSRFQGTLNSVLDRKRKFRPE